MLLDVILISFVVAFIRGGRIREIPSFNRVWLLVTSIIVQLISVVVPNYAYLFISLGYLFILLFFLSNYQYEELRIFLIGWLLNALVIWTNFGRMPIDIDQARKTGFPVDALVNGTDFKHLALTNSTHLGFLGDIIYIPFPIPRIISIGDLFVMIGAFLLVQRFMNKPISLMKLRMGNKHARI